MIPLGVGIISDGDTVAQLPPDGCVLSSTELPYPYMRRTRDGGTPVDRVRLLQLRDDLRAEQAELTETLSAVEAALVGVEKLLARSVPTETREAHLGLDAVLEDPSRPSHPTPTNALPRGSRAVEAILIDTSDWMTAQDLAAAQLERGWPPESDEPVNAVRAAANRLVASKPDLFVREQGRYRHIGGSGRQSSLNGGLGALQADASVPPRDRPSSVVDGQTRGDWQDLPRTEAVARMLAEAGEPLSPKDLSRRLQEVGRDDPPLAVGKALNHLYRKQRANTVRRAKWILTDPNDPWKAPATTGVAQEQDEASGDQDMSPAALAFTGDGQLPDTSSGQYEGAGGGIESTYRYTNVPSESGATKPELHQGG
jgi:hypothetical protein